MDLDQITGNFRYCISKLGKTKQVHLVQDFYSAVPAGYRHTIQVWSVAVRIALLRHRTYQEQRVMF